MRHAWAAIALCGCAETARPAIVLPARRYHDALVVEARVGHDTHDAVIDSGAPWAALDPAAFPSLAPTTALGPTVDIDVNSLVLAHQLYQTLPICRDACSTMPGAALPLRAFAPAAVTFDYRAATVTVGGAVPAGVVVPARVLAGSRWLVAATIEGVPVTALVDTGSSLVIVRQAALARWLGDGRASTTANTISGLGASTGRISRARAIEVGGAVVRDVPIEATPTMDVFLDGVSKQTGVRVDALLGVSFLRDFAVTFALAPPRLVLRR